MESPTEGSAVPPAPAGLIAPADAASSYAVKLPTFEGPLDLLLHLIRLNEMEITDIPVARICEQYLGYLDLMRELDIDVAAEYLVMAATLAWIKSQMLLPTAGGDEEEEGVDPREDLVRRLLDYQRYKEVAEQLGERHRLGRDVFAVRPMGPDRPPASEREIDVDLTALLQALRDVLKSAPVSGTAHELWIEPVTVRERMVAIVDRVGAEESVEFTALLRDTEEDELSRAWVVTTFLAILELARIGVVRLYQGRDETGAPQGPIHVRGRSDAPEGDWSATISEYM